MNQRIQSMPTGYYNYSNAPSVQTFGESPALTMQPQQPSADTVQFKGQQQPEEESFLSKHWGKLLVGGALILGAILTHGKLWGKAEEAAGKSSGSAENAGKEVKKAGDAAKNEAGETSSELGDLLEKRESAKDEDLIDLTKKIRAKTTDDDKLLEENRKLLEYLEKAEKGEISLKKGSFRAGKYSTIPVEKEDALCAIGEILEKKGNNTEALSHYQKALALNEYDSGIVPSIMIVLIKENRTDEGISLAMKYLKSRKNEMANDNQVNLIRALANGLKSKGKTDVAESFELIVKGSYHYDQLTPEDFEKLSKAGLSKQKVKTLTGAETREQTGAMAKWVIAQVNSLDKK